MNTALAALKINGFGEEKGFLSSDAVRAISESISNLWSYSKQAGYRGLVNHSAQVKAFADSPKVMSFVQSALGEEATLVRSVLFTKSATMNWAVGWHQDLSIAVNQRVDRAGYQNWSEKGGIIHVQPPVAVLEKTITLRLHLDEVNEQNGALIVVPGSHKQGRISASSAAAVAKQQTVFVCRAQPGDLLFFKPLLLHSSKKALAGTPRRIVHLEFSAARLPYPLEWNNAA